MLFRSIERLRRRRRIERWLLLAARALALLLVGLAMAGPMVRSLAASARERWIVIDDAATSAERMPDGRTVIDWLREQVRTQMQDLHEGDRVALVSTSQPASVLLPATLDLQRALREVDALSVHAVPANWREAIDLSLPKVGEKTAMPRELVLVGSFRRGSVDPENPLPSGWSDRLQDVRRWCVQPPGEAGANRSIGEVRVGRSKIGRAHV